MRLDDDASGQADEISLPGKDAIQPVAFPASWLATSVGRQERSRPFRQSAETLPRRDLNKLRKLLFGQRRRRVFQIDRVADDDVETNDPVRIYRLLREETIAGALGFF